MIRAASLRRNEHVLAAAVLAFLLSTMFFPYLYGDMNLMSASGDAPSITPVGGPGGNLSEPIDASRAKLLDIGSGLLAEPSFSLAFHELFVDRVAPIWNPDAAFGTPFAAEMQQQPFYPLTAIVTLVRNPTTFAAYVLLRLFVAGFATYAFLRFFVGFAPALGGGIAFMLNGYFFKYETMPHLSVETLMGALFLGVEFVLRGRRPWIAVPFLAALVWVDLLGGMPESSFVSIVFALVYGLFRIASVPSFRAAWLSRVRDLAFATACGFACAAFLLLPFAEFVANSFNIHEPSKVQGPVPGLAIDTHPITSLGRFIMPLLFGTTQLRIELPKTDGHFGAAAIFCALAAVVYAILCRSRRHAMPIVFFASAATLLIAKRFGLPLVNWIGALPVVRMVLLQKYDEPATAFAVAALVGFGLHALFVNRRRRGAIALLSFFASLGLLQLAYTYNAGVMAGRLPQAAGYFYAALLGALVALIAIAAIAALGATNRVRFSDSALGGLAILAIATEMNLNYFVPMYYFVDPGPSKSQNPYLGAPFIDYLRRKSERGARVYAEKTQFLWTNWSEAFDLKDVRYIDALADDRYLPFVRAFIPSDDHTDLLEDFTGTSSYTLATPVGQKLLSLGSVHYIVSPVMLDPTSLGGIIAGYASKRGSARDVPAVGQFRLGDDWHDGLRQTEDSKAFSVPVDVPPGARAIALALGVDDAFWNASGGRADFLLRIASDGGRARTLIVRHFEHGRAESRGWRRAEIDIRNYAGKHVRLSLGFQANGAARGAPGYWGAFRFERERGEPDPFVLAKHFEHINVFAFARPLPHGALYSNLKLSDDDKATLDTLTSPEFDIFKRVIVSRESVPAELEDAVRGLSLQVPASAQAATLDAYTPTRIDYHTDERAPTLLFVSDTFYPGWKAFVDSRETPILRANYLFRGVVVGAGKHVVEFRYDPLTFRAGLALCAISLLVLAGFAFWSKRAAARRLRIAVAA